jgi:dihydroflavonol-4-reductase
MSNKVLVSGGSGYIAGFLIRQLVAEGWTVHTTVRSLAKEDAVRQLLAVDNGKLRFFATWRTWPRPCPAACRRAPTS